MPTWDRNLKQVEEVKWAIARNLTLVLVATSLVLGIINILDPKNAPGGIAYLACTFIVSCNFILLYKYKIYTPTYYIIIFTGLVVCTLALFLITHHIHAADFLWRLTLILLAIIGISTAFSRILIAYFIIESIIYIQWFLNPNIADTTLLPRNELIALNIELIMPFLINSYLIYNFLYLQKVAQSKLEQAYGNLKQSNQENITLLKEIHHRVKNNLQIVTSLLRLQRDDLKTEEAKTQFTSAVNRVLAMSAIHEKLYQQKKLSELKIAPYINDLAQDLKVIYARDLKIDFQYNIEKSKIDLKTIIPLGLIINELLTNSFKYAFGPSTAKPTIQISILPTEKGFTMRYADNGTWKENKNSKHFGSELISILSDQINGSYNLAKKPTGTHYDFTFQET